LKTIAHKIFKNQIARNAASLSVVQVCRKLIPLVMLPYLAHVLGPTGWGHVAFAQSMGDFIALFAEFGFVLSATRELAQNRHSRETCSVIASGTLGAQAILTLLGILAAVTISTWVPFLHDHPRLLIAGLIYGGAQGLAPMWLFQGLERMSLSAALEVGSKLFALGGVFLFVHSASDEWKVLAFQGLSPLIASIVGIWLAHRFLTLQMPTVETVLRALRSGWSMFLLRSGIAAYSTANVLILGLFAPAAVVGYYASAEKLAKAIAGLLMPIRDAFYPRLSQLAAHSPAENQRLTRISAMIEGACGLMLTLVTFFGASLIIHTVFGKTFGGAIPILQILSVLPFILSLTDAIGFQSLLPAGKEHLVTAAILGGASVNVVLAFIFAPRLGGIGMAISAAIAEVVVCCILIWIVSRTTNLFSRRMVQPDFAAMARAAVEAPARTAK